MPSCFISCCNHDSKRDLCKFFRFPTNEVECQMWNDAVGQARAGTMEDRICSCHFENGERVYGPRVGGVYQTAGMSSTRSQAGDEGHLSNANSSFASCSVPQCSSTDETVGKLLIPFPQSLRMRRKWCDSIQCPEVDFKTSAFCCSDHFDLENDMENYARWRQTPGTKIELKSHVVPHVFVGRGRSGREGEDEQREQRRRAEVERLFRVRIGERVQELLRQRREPGTANEETAGQKTIDQLVEENLREDQTIEQSSEENLRRGQMIENLVEEKLKEGQMWSEGSSVAQFEECPMQNEFEVKEEHEDETMEDLEVESSYYNETVEDAEVECSYQSVEDAEVECSFEQSDIGDLEQAFVVTTEDNPESANELMTVKIKEENTDENETEADLEIKQEYADENFEYNNMEQNELLGFRIKEELDDMALDNNLYEEENDATNGNDNSYEEEIDDGNSCTASELNVDVKDENGDDFGVTVKDEYLVVESKDNQIRRHVRFDHCYHKVLSDGATQSCGKRAKVKLKRLFPVDDVGEYYQADSFVMRRRDADKYILDARGEIAHPRRCFLIKNLDGNYVTDWYDVFVDTKRTSFADGDCQVNTMEYRDQSVQCLRKRKTQDAGTSPMKRMADAATCMESDSDWSSDSDDDLDL